MLAQCCCDNDRVELLHEFINVVVGPIGITIPFLERFNKGKLQFLFLPGNYWKRKVAVIVLYFTFFFAVFLDEGKVVLNTAEIVAV